MAELADGRVYKRKRLKDSTDENTYLDIPVIYEAKFKSMVDQAQEFFVYFDNSINSSRKVHTKRVTNNKDSSQYIDVERIDEWNIKITQEQAQESIFVMTNTDPPPIQPDGSNHPAHQKVHYVRFFKDNDANSDVWCDIELIDELKIKCMAEQAQEYTWFMKHPELGDIVDDPDAAYPLTKGYCDPGLELASAEGGIDPPYRTDPFQNIININWFAEETTSIPCHFDGNYGGFGPTTGVSEDVLGWTVIDLQGHFVRWGTEAEALASLEAIPESLGDQGQNFFWYIGPAQYGVGYALMTKPTSDPGCAGDHRVSPPP